MAASTIVDINGNPFDMPDLEEQQTVGDVRLSPLRTHYSNHPSKGLTIPKIARILIDGEQGDLVGQCELAEDMEEKDPHIQSELGKRKLALLGVDWNIVPPVNATDTEKRDAEMIEEILRDATWLDDAIFDAADAILKGFANLELQWQYADKMHYIAGAEWRDPAWFQTHPDNRNQLRIRDGSHEGIALQPFGWMSHQAKSKSGYLSRRGLMRVLAWPYLFKNYAARDLAEFLEIYGLPTRVGKYPTGADSKEKSTLMRAVMSIGHNAGGVIPKGMDIEFHEAAKGGSDPYMAQINWCEKSQSKAILGGTLTSQADGKSSTNALGNVHNEVRQEIRNADLKALANTITRDIVYPMYVLNGRSFTSPRRIPRFEFDITEPEDVKAFSEYLPGLVGMGVQVPVSWVHEKLQIPEAAEGEPVLQMQGQQPAPSTGGDEVAELKASLAALKAERETESTQDQDALDNAIDGLPAEDLQGQMQQVLGPVFEQLKSSEPDQALGMLAELFPEMDDGQLQDQLAQVMFVSEIWGRLNAQS